VIAANPFYCPTQWVPTSFSTGISMRIPRRDFLRSSAAAFVGSSLGLLNFAGGCHRSTGSATAPIGTTATEIDLSISKDPVMDPYVRDLHSRTFRFFWDTTDHQTGLTPDRWPTLTFCSVASVGFALTAYCIGTERGYVSRDDAATRTRNTLRFFWNLPQSEAASGVGGHHGFFYHFLNFSDGCRFEKVELSSIDTTLFLFGALTAQEYFDRENPQETEIRELARKLIDRVDWNFLMRPSGMLGMGWHPETGYIKAEWTGYNEGMLCYLLGMASSTSPIDPGVWTRWCSTYDKTWGPNFGPQPHVGYFSIAVHQLPNLWYDLRAIADPYMREKGLTYFENARRATLAARAYAIANPAEFRDYSDEIWGFTACDGPFDGEVTIEGRTRAFRTYSERGQGTRAMFDDGTIAPTAALSSMPFTPDESSAALTAFRKKYGDDIYGQYGFFDAFNPTYRGDLTSPSGRLTSSAGWVSNDYLGIDQGPILIMLENHTSELIWQRLRASTTIRQGLIRAGFEPVSAEGEWLNA
jgi:hypothetical protein